MITAKADERKRLVVPLARPGQVYDVQDGANGSIVLVPVKAERKSRPFDPHLYDDIHPATLKERQALEAASAKVDVGIEERDRQ